MALREIVTWSESLYLWQRDALRMLVEGIEPDVEEMVKMCLAEAGFPQEGARKPIPLTEEHIPGVVEPQSNVTLKAIHSIKNVNALHSGASMCFPPEGLYVVYGENGSGKTGFGRVLSSICRCTVKPKVILGNIYAKGTDKPSGIIEYAVGKEEKTFNWTPDECSEDLQSVSFFDSQCAPVYVTQENAVAFAPFGLGLLKRLADLCDAVRERVAAKEKEFPDINIKLDDQLNATASARWMKKLNGSESEEDICAMVAFSEEDSSRLAVIQKALTEEDPEKRAKELEAKKKRLVNAKDRMAELCNALDNKAIKSIEPMLTRLNEAKKAEEIVRKAAFREDALHGTGSPAWRSLWDAAKRFVGEAYPGSTSPASVEVTRCIFCQQTLEKDAQERLHAFETFVLGEASKILNSAQQEIKHTINGLSELKLSQPDDEALFSELGEELGGCVKEYLERAGQAAAWAVYTLKSEDWINPGEDIPLIDDVSAKLSQIIEQIEKDIKVFKDAVDPAKKIKLISENYDITARKALNVNQASIRQKISNLRTRKLLDAASKNAKSNKITLKNNELTDKYVTKEVQLAFTQRMDDLFKGRNFVTLQKTRAAKGLTYFQVKLSGAVQDSSVERVVSEGEFRGIALAAFLAELDLAPSKSAIVFDDPVSSLDTPRRKTIAEALAILATNRQLIVFTHDLYFLAQLLTAAKDKVPVEDVQLLRRGQSFGHLLATTPMSVKGFNERATDIEKQAQRAKQLQEQGDMESSIDAAFRSASQMRMLTEHIVEKVILGGVVVRFDQALHADNPPFRDKKLLNITEEDIDLVNRLMADYSVYLHDRTVEDQVPPPDPDIILRDLQEVREWKNKFKKRA